MARGINEVVAEVVDLTIRLSDLDVAITGVYTMKVMAELGTSHPQHAQTVILLAESGTDLEVLHERRSRIRRRLEELRTELMPAASPRRTVAGKQAIGELFHGGRPRSTA